MKFRLLKSSEIECRVSTVKKTGCSLLLYKDARCDMNILDETVGALNWMREHKRDNANCVVSIWDTEKEQWISKEDTGTESFTEKEKGLASDSFKRACFNWGIGRELYTAPFIWIELDRSELTEKNGKTTTYARFYVKEIEYTKDRVIKSVKIVDKKGNTRFPNSYDDKPKKQWGKSDAEKLVSDLKDAGVKIDWLKTIEPYNVKKISDLTKEQMDTIRKENLNESK